MSEQELYKTKLIEELSKYYDRYENNYIEETSEHIRIIDTLYGGYSGDAFPVEIYCNCLNPNNIEFEYLVCDELVGTVSFGKIEDFYNLLANSRLDEKKHLDLSIKMYKENGPYSRFIESLDLDNCNGTIFYYDNALYIGEYQDEILVIDDYYDCSPEEASRILNLLYDEAKGNTKIIDIWSLPENEGITNSSELLSEAKRMNRIVRGLDIVEDDINILCEHLKKLLNEIPIPDTLQMRIKDILICKDRKDAIFEFYSDLYPEDNSPPVIDNYILNISNDSIEI